MMYAVKSLPQRTKRSTSSNQTHTIIALTVLFALLLIAAGSLLIFRLLRKMASSPHNKPAGYPESAEELYMPKMRTFRPVRRPLPVARPQHRASRHSPPVIERTARQPPPRKSKPTRVQGDRRHPRPEREDRDCWSGPEYDNDRGRRWRDEPTYRCRWPPKCSLLLVYEELTTA